MTTPLSRVMMMKTTTKRWIRRLRGEKDIRNRNPIRFASYFIAVRLFPEQTRDLKL